MSYRILSTSKRFFPSLDLYVVPVEEPHVAVMEVGALSKLFDMEKYFLPPVVEGKNNKPRTEEIGDNTTHGMAWHAFST
jgi:hypothetical protein